MLSSCKKEGIEQPENVTYEKIIWSPQTPEEIKLVANLRKITDVFMELYKENQNIRVVNAAIFAKLYTDESVLVKDLIFPENAVLNNNKSFVALSQKFKADLGSFARDFWIQVNLMNDSEFKRFLINLNNGSNIVSNTHAYQSVGDEVSVYFPYSDEFETFEPSDGGGYYAPLTTITTATADADEGWGELPYYINGVFQHYTQVLINDDYVFQNPTHIIGVNGIELDGEGTTLSDPPPPPPPPGVSRVYMGEVLCKKQYDKLISFTGNGGGSEVKYCRLTGYLQPVNGQVTTFQDIVSVGFSRSDIKNQRWKKSFTVWHPDWVTADNEQILGIYEEDNTNSRTFTGSLGTTLTITAGNTVTGSIGYSVTVASQDDIIRQLKISRHSYFTGSFQNQGWDFSEDDTFLPPPFTHGWPRYDGNEKEGAEVCWTWPYNVYP